jgi:hypothetical protein
MMFVWLRGVAVSRTPMKLGATGDPHEALPSDLVAYARMHG